MSYDVVGREVLRLLQAGRITRDAARDLLTTIRAAAEQPPAADSAARSPAPTRPGVEPVAIVGLAFQLPGARDLDELWRVFNRESDLIDALPEDRRALCAPYLDREADRIGVDAARPYMTGSWLDDVDRFDAAFFGMTPAEADATDPQQRRFLQVAYECLERAGYAGNALRGSRTGVYVAAASTDYLDALPEVSPVAVPGNVPSFVASRLSFLYDLRGPSYVVSSTCASSLLALHDALNGLALGDCDMALVGGVNIFPYPVRAERWVMNASGIMAEDDRCRPFSDDGDGIGRGEGVAALLLKPLSAAKRDHDNIVATILSSATNSDGTSAAITAPSPAAHTRLLLDAWRRAGVEPTELDYLEAHGTGTRLGDPIEIKGITDAVRRSTDARQFLAVGSVKGHLGHLLDGMAGLSGLLRALLVVRHGTVPPTANVDMPNRHIDFLDSPVFVPTEAWPLARPADRPLRAGVSCFGFNGTNVHVVLEAAPRRVAPRDIADRRWPFPLSARDPRGLAELVRRWSTFDASTLGIADVCFTLWAGREHFAERVVIEADDLATLRERCGRLAVRPPEEWAEEPGVFVAADSCEGIVARFLAGEAPDGAELFDDLDVRRVELPLYPFDERSHWVGEPVAPSVGAADETPDEAVARLVRETLRVDEVDVDKDFVSVGGTSLSALQLTARLRRELGANVAVEHVLTAPSLRELADRLAPRADEPSGKAGGPEPAIMTASAVASTTPVMSSVQRRFWFLEQLRRESGHYNLPLLLRLVGPLDVEALRQALRAVERRHTVLGYRYPADDAGMPTMVAGAPPPRLDERTVTGDKLTSRQQAALELARHEITRPFDLASGPVWRASLIRIDEAEHLLAVTAHHLVSDIWSLTLLDSELRAFYNAARQARPAAVEPLELSYGDWAALEHDALRGEGLAELERYWRETLAGLGRPVELPTDRPRAGEAPPVGGQLTFTIPPRIAELVARACAERHVTPFMVLFTALAAVAHQLTGQDDIVIGTETANRAMPGADALIGAFVNQLPVRVRVGDRTSFGELLARTRAAALGAFAHETLPFDRIVRLTGQARTPGTTPLFGVKLLFSDLSWQEQPMHGLDVEHVDIESAASPFDFTLRVFRASMAGGETLSGSLSYRPDLFDAATAERYVLRFQDVLERGLTDLASPIKDLVPRAPDRGRSSGRAGIAGRRRLVTGGSTSSAQ